MDLEWLGNVVFHLGRIVLQASYVTEEAQGFKREVLDAVGESSVPLGMDIIPRVCSLRVRLRLHPLLPPHMSSWRPMRRTPKGKCGNHRTDRAEPLDSQRLCRLEGNG